MSYCKVLCRTVSENILYSKWSVCLTDRKTDSRKIRDPWKRLLHLKHKIFNISTIEEVTAFKAFYELLQCSYTLTADSTLHRQLASSHLICRACAGAASPAVLWPHPSLLLQPGAGEDHLRATLSPPPALSPLHT